MVDRERGRNVQEAAARFAETVAESYRLVYGQAAETQERQQRLAREFSERVVDHLREQTESGREASGVLADQARRQQEAGRELAQESVAAYVEFLNTAFSQYREGTQRAAGGAQEGARILSETTAGLVGTAAGTAGATAGATADATLSAAETAAGQPPIAGYDEMNVDEISGRLDTLTDEQIRQLRDYERANQNRKTLMERFESRLRASS